MAGPNDVFFLATRLPMSSMRHTSSTSTSTVTFVISFIFRSWPRVTAKSPRPPAPTVPAMAVRFSRLMAVMVVPRAMAGIPSRR